MQENHREYPCDLCGSTVCIELPYARLYHNDQPVHICRQCGFVYVRYRRSTEAILLSKRPVRPRR